MKGSKIESFEDLEVYQKLCQLHLEVREASLRFPKFELHELGSQLRRSSNSAPANIAEEEHEGYRNRYLEAAKMLRGLERSPISSGEK